MNLRDFARHCLIIVPLVFITIVSVVPHSSFGASASKPVKFITHRLGSFRSEACGVGDFNNDGRIDIVAGPYWYQAPSWKPHQYRSLEGKVDEKGKTYAVDENGKGYWDDFMNLPLDVDGDGLLDVVTCCWFSRQIDWHRNTGPSGGQWPVILGEKNGNYECGDLWDIDGDGRNHEILAHTKDTKWYEAGTRPDGKRGLIRHDVSKNQRLFGGGVGDVNGDGRPDIVRPDAWYEGPADPRKGPWKEHPLAVGSLTEGQAEHTPQIWIYDVDADGLNDIVTSSAHKHGLFWYKQMRDGKKLSFKQHLIDKSWSQVHSITLADMDADGDLDIVTGKRFFAHNGNDPDAHSPLGVYWYELDRTGAIRWTQHIISRGERIGSSLSIPVVDIDGDGDLDVVVTGKWGGPVLFENTAKSN